MQITEPSSAPSPTVSPKPRGAWIVISVVALALLARIALLLTTHHRNTSEDQSIAQHLVDGQGYAITAFAHTGPTSVRPPVYSMLLATLYAIAGPERGDVAAMWLNAAFGGASAAIAYVLARRMGARAAGAAVFALLIAVWPTQLVATIYPQGLSLAVLLMLTTLCLATFDDVRIAMLAGLCAGFAVLTESVLLLPLLFSMVWMMRRKPASTVLAIAGALVLVGPWVYRNAIVHGRFVGVTTTLWADVFQGNGDNATGSHLPQRASSDRPVSRVQLLSPIDADQLKRQPEAVRESLLRRWSVDWIEAHPLDYARLCLIRVGKTLWTDWHHPLAFRWTNVLSRSVALVGFVVAVIATIRSSAMRTPMRIAIPFLLGVTLVSGFTLAEARNAAFVDLAQLLPIAWLIRGRPA